MPTAQHIHFEEIVGAAGGPRLLITGGVHGDEYEPMAAIRRLIRDVEPLSLRGTLLLAPVVNEPAFERRDRVGPDGLDLAQVVPVTQRLCDAADCA